MFWFVLIIVAIALFYIKTKKVFEFWKEKGIKYVEPTYFFGNMSILPRKPMTERIDDIYNVHRDERYVGVYEFFVPALLIKDPDLIKQITIKDFESFSDHKSRVDVDLDPLFGRNLMQSKGKKWHDLRATISPTFTGSKMRTMFHLMDNCALQFIQHFKTLTSTNILNVEMRDIFTRYTNDVIATTAFGIECDSLKNPNNEFYLQGKEATNFGLFRSLVMFCSSISPFLSKLFKIRIMPKSVGDYFSGIITEAIEYRKKHNTVRPDMINLLMKAMKGDLKYEEDNNLNVNEGFATVDEYTKTKNVKKIDLQDAIAQAFIFFLAGFETGSQFLSFAFYELALNPDIQQRLRNEIKNVFSQNNNKITYESLLSMKYLDMVISETLRKWPPSVLTDRVATKEYTIQPTKPDEKPLVLEKDSYIWLPIYSLHHDSKYFPNPDKFDPERFNDENKQNIHTGAYIPFGSGPRNCIGSRFALLELKLIIFHVLNNFEVVPIEKTHIPMVLDPKRINMMAKGGMWLGLKKLV